LAGSHITHEAAWKRLALHYSTALLLSAIASFLVACGGGGGGDGDGGGPIIANVFQTTFDCPDWNQTMGLDDSDVCSNGDGIEGGGDWSTSNGSVDQITAAANNPAGGGGKGFRHWAGDGVNNNGGGIVVQWVGVSEMWFRYYIRFQAVAWDPSTVYMKTIYCNRGVPGTFYFGLHDNVIGGYVEADLRTHKSTVSFVNWQGGSTGDGNFHALEVHAKMNTTGASSDGVLEYWLNGTLIYSNSTLHFSDTTGARWTNCLVGSNQNAPQNGADAYVDFDDIAVSAAG